MNMLLVMQCSIVVHAKSAHAHRITKRIQYPYQKIYTIRPCDEACVHGKWWTQQTNKGHR